MSSRCPEMRKNRDRLSGVALALLLGAAQAQAADYLRGAYGGHQGLAPIEQPQPSGVDWAGVYAGAHAGMTSVRTDFAGIGRSLGLNVLPNLAITDQIPAMVRLGNSITQGTSYGGFAGINYLWDDVVLGVEVDYTRSSIAASAASSMSRTLSAASTGTDAWVTTVNASARTKVQDWWTLRGRVGWAAGYFMPFMTAGLAFGNATSSGTATGTTSQFAVTIDPITGLPVYTLRGSTTNTTNMRHRGISYGGAVGAGVDMAFFSNFFIRAEWQYVQFASGGNRPELGINTGRVAGAVKF